MQAYLNFFDKLDKLIASASHGKRLSLGLFVCKELYPDYIKFDGRNKIVDPDFLKEAIDFCEKSTDTVNDKILSEFIAGLEPIIPDTEEYLEIEVSYALNAAGAVFEMLHYLKDGNPLHISDTCSYMIDTIDFKIADANPHLSDDGIFKHPQMVVTMKELIAKISK